ncbi:MAG: hypothetical protein ABTA16_08380 [Niallia sp.]
MNIEAIYQNAQVISESVNGEINRVQIWRDEYDYLISLVGQKNEYKGYCDEFIELDYHGEFIPLFQKAKLLSERVETK